MSGADGDVDAVDAVDAEGRIRDLLSTPAREAVYPSSRPGWGGQLLDRLHMDWKTHKVIGEEPLLLEPEVRARIRDVRFGPDGMLYVLTDSKPPATAKLLKITPKK